MKKLIEELKSNGFAQNPFRTLNYVYSNTLQDGQYSPEAREAARKLEKYIKEYGTFTIQKIYHLDTKYNIS